jgi:hypothetical protein
MLPLSVRVRVTKPDAPQHAIVERLHFDDSPPLPFFPKGWPKAADVRSVRALRAIETCFFAEQVVTGRRLDWIGRTGSPSSSAWRNGCNACSFGVLLTGLVGARQTGYMACAGTAGDSIMAVANQDITPRYPRRKLSRLSDDLGAPSAPATAFGLSSDDIRLARGCFINVCHSILVGEDPVVGGLRDHFGAPGFRATFVQRMPAR